MTYDLEDAVTPTSKGEARERLRLHMEALGSQARPFRELAVRINPAETRHARKDLSTLAKLPNLDAVVVPKVQSAADLTFVADLVRDAAPERHKAKSENPIKILAQIESAKGIMDLREICKATPLLSGLIFGAEDFALDLSLKRTPSLREFEYARSAMVTAARAAGLDSVIDLVCTHYRGSSGLKTLAKQCEDGKVLGFNGKQCIHPNQLDIVHEKFSPSVDELEWAVRVLVANDKALAQGRGVWSLDGRMIDAPVAGRAAAIAKRGRLADMEVDKMLQKWRHAEPE